MDLLGEQLDEHDEAAASYAKEKYFQLNAVKGRITKVASGYCDYYVG